MFVVLTLTVDELLQKELELGIASCAVDMKRDSILQPAPTGMKVTIVAKQGERGDDWAAYTGIPAQCRTYAAYTIMGIDMNEPDFIARHGDKVNPVLAEALFPSFIEAGMIYRR